MGYVTWFQVELVPDLSQCIETVAKNEYRETVAKLLAALEENFDSFWTILDRKLVLRPVQLSCGGRYRTRTCDLLRVKCSALSGVAPRFLE